MSVKDVRPGMSSVKDIPIIQDGAPPGGYPSIRYARQIPNTGPSGLALFSVLGLFMGYGWYKIIQNNYQRNKDATEKREARIMIASLLQAEADARYVEEDRAKSKLDDEIMKDVKEWQEMKVIYNGKRWLPPIQKSDYGIIYGIENKYL